jgi:hypothetical protein
MALQFWKPPFESLKNIFLKFDFLLSESAVHNEFILIFSGRSSHAIGKSEPVQMYYPDAHRYAVLFEYPGASIPESIPIPEHRLLTLPLMAAIGQSVGNQS